MKINKKSKIFIAGHNGMVGSAIKRKFERGGFTKKGTVLADQRLAHTISKTQIIKYGTKIR